MQRFFLIPDRKQKRELPKMYSFTSGLSILLEFDERLAIYVPSTFQFLSLSLLTCITVYVRILIILAICLQWTLPLTFQVPNPVSTFRCYVSPRNHRSQRPYLTSHNIMVYHNEEFSATRPISKQADTSHAIRNCLINKATFSLHDMYSSNYIPILKSMRLSGYGKYQRGMENIRSTKFWSQNRRAQTSSKICRWKIILD